MSQESINSNAASSTISISRPRHESSSVSSDCGGTTAVHNLSAFTPQMIVSHPMVLVGCTQCLMYVMSSQTDPKCPRCKSTGLLDFLSEEEEEEEEEEDVITKTNN